MQWFVLSSAKKGTVKSIVNFLITQEPLSIESERNIIETLENGSHPALGEKLELKLRNFSWFYLISLWISQEGKKAAIDWIEYLGKEKIATTLSPKMNCCEA
jgi:hypothetical protein